MFSIRNAYDSFKKLQANREGNVVVEAAFLFMMIAGMSVLTFEVGRLAYEQARLENVVRAGAQYGLRGQASANNIDAIKEAALKAAGSAATEITVMAETVCRCPGAAGTASCLDVCTDDNPTEMVMTVSATRELPLVIGWPGYETHSLSAETSVRAR